MCDFSCGWIAGMMGLVVGHPFDTVKVNQQTQGTKMFQCAKTIFENSGYKGFFRGLAFPLLANGAINSVLFGVFGVTLETLQQLEKSQLFNFHIIEASTNSTDQLVVSDTPNRFRLLNNLIAGGAGGLAQVFISCPVEVIKIKLQTEKTLINGKGDRGAEVLRMGSKVGPTRLLSHIIKTNGVIGLYQGFIPMVSRDIPASTLYLLMYSTSSAWVNEWGKDKPESATVLGMFIAGGIAGVASWWIILPLDVIKSRIQADNPQNPVYKGMRHCAFQVLKEQGLKGLFRGFWPISLRAFPANGVTFIAFEWLSRFCRYLNGNGEHKISQFQS